MVGNGYHQQSHLRIDIFKGFFITFHFSFYYNYTSKNIVTTDTRQTKARRIGDIRTYFVTAKTIALHSINHDWAYHQACRLSHNKHFISYFFYNTWILNLQ